MSEMKFNVKGPVGAVIAVVVIGVVVYVKFFIPFSPTSSDKKAIMEKIENLRLSEMSQVSGANMKQYKNTGKFRDDSKELKNLSGKIEITEIQGKKGFLSGTKIKVIYTIDGKTPKSDGGVLFFKLYYKKRRKSSIRKKVELTQITEDYYKK
jgi:lipopolysaccharide export LptBFGC system permease protein LptF